MTTSPYYYVVGAIAAVWLVLLWETRARTGSGRRKLLVGAIATAVLLVPWGNLPLWSRAFSFFANPSVSLLGVICAALWQRLFGSPVLRDGDWRALWIYGAVVGTAVYLHPFAGGVDLYYWGWSRDPALFVLAAVTIALLAIGSRLGVLTLAALVAFAVDALESENCWDYLVDPVFWLTSVVALARRGFYALRGGRRLLPGAALQPVEAANRREETAART